MAPQQETQQPLSRISPDDLKHLTEIADRDRNGVLSKEEVTQLIADYNNKKLTNARTLEILKKYDANADGHIDPLEGEELHHQLSIGETGARYAGYSAILASRAFRYLAFTSDLGEALRPVAHARLVTGSYAIALGYCFVDVGYEAYKHVQRGYVTEHSVPQPLAQVVVERATFQALASLAIPAFLIHGTVSAARKVCARIGRFQKWGPSVAGLAFIPLLPLYLDHPVEAAIEKGFQRFGPWASPSSTSSTPSAAASSGKSKEH